MWYNDSLWSSSLSNHEQIQLNNRETNKLTFYSCQQLLALFNYFIPPSPPSLLSSSSTSLLWPFPLSVSRVSLLISYQHLEQFPPAPHSEWPISATSLKTRYATWKYCSSCILLHIHSAPWISLAEISIETAISIAFWDVILDSAIRHRSLDLVLRPARYRSY